ncbi:MAG: hypothetical protein II705_02050 [Clostridia bacterium]|nr:hypothetical protein [Clostridia bacterium]
MELINGYEYYYDGIPKEIEAMTLEELEASIKEEEKKVEEMNRAARKNKRKRNRKHDKPSY